MLRRLQTHGTPYMESGPPHQMMSMIQAGLLYVVTPDGTQRALCQDNRTPLSESMQVQLRTGDEISGPFTITWDEGKRVFYMQYVEKHYCERLQVHQALKVEQEAVKMWTILRMINQKNDDEPLIPDELLFHIIVFLCEDFACINPYAHEHIEKKASRWIQVLGTKTSRGYQALHRYNTRGAPRYGQGQAKRRRKNKKRAKKKKFEEQGDGTKSNPIMVD